MQIVVHILPDRETEHKDIPVENETTREFAQAQEADESLKHVRRSVTQKNISHTKRPSMPSSPGMANVQPIG